MLNPNVMMVVRYGLIALGGVMAGKGFLPKEAVPQAVDYTMAALGPAVVLGTFIWGLVTNSQSNRIAQTAALPGVEAVVTNTQALADNVPAPNVVSTVDAGLVGMDAIQHAVAKAEARKP